MKAIHVTQYGGSEVLQVVEVPEPKPSPRQALIDIKVTGYNFHDAATRQGIFPDPPIPVPFIPGVEAAGIVEAIGDEVTEVKVGDACGKPLRVYAYHSTSKVLTPMQRNPL